MSDPSPSTHRLSALDAHRGLIMVLMAIDHASYFIARVHSREIWGAPLPAYPDAAWFFTRWVTHLCAPGFFLLMGMSMTLLSAGRREAGWTEWRITRFFVVRGLLLVLFQLVVENGAWMFGDATVRAGAGVVRGGPLPGGGSEAIVYLGVLFSLGGSLLFWAFLRRAPSWLVAALSLAAVILTQLAVPGAGQAGTLYSPIVRALLIPGHTDRVEVLYPVVPWLGVTGAGLLLGRLLRARRGVFPETAFFGGLALLALFVFLRLEGGSFNIDAAGPGWMGFLDVVKYPPGIAFLSVTLGINLLLMACWRRAAPYLRGRNNPLLVYGRTALFFYLVHLWLFALLGLFFRGGAGLPTMYAVWLLGLAVLYPLCLLYGRFKRRKSAASLWRLL